MTQTPEQSLGHEPEIVTLDPSPVALVREAVRMVMDDHTLINRITKKPGANLNEVGLTLGSWKQRRGEFDIARAPADSVVSYRLTGALERADSYRDPQFLDRKALAGSVRLDGAVTLNQVAQLGGSVASGEDFAYRGTGSYVIAAPGILAPDGTVTLFAPSGGITQSLGAPITADRLTIGASGVVALDGGGATAGTADLNRVATLGPVPAEAIAMLEELLERRIAASHGQATLTMGGARGAAEIINNAGKAAEKRIMPELTRIDKTLAREIESEMFKFEHLFALDPQAMGSLLREVESDMLINALKGIADVQREVFFRAMSSRAAPSPLAVIGVPACTVKST